MKRRTWKRPEIVEDLDAIPPELRTQPHDEYDSGIWWFYEPLTVLRSDDCGLALEIVRVRSCMNKDCRLGHCEKRGCDTHYEARAVSIGSCALQVLLEDAAKYIENLEKAGS